MKISLKNLTGCIKSLNRCTPAILIAGIYIKYKQEVLNEEIESSNSVEDQFQAMVKADKTAKPASGLAWVSIIPPLCIFALFAGIAAWRKGTERKLAAGWAIVSGGMFTFFYVIITIGMLLPKASPYDDVSYSFLASENPELQLVTDNIENSDFISANSNLTALTAGMEDKEWPYLCAEAVTQWGLANYDQADILFYKANKTKPQSSEFYSTYGSFILANEDDPQEAAKMFRKAVELDSGNRCAESYAQLFQNEYNPTKFQTTSIYVVVLLMLITLHEFAHAYTAHKLGDDTAKLQGRCSLNPLAHIDLFGSIIVPAALIMSGSEFLFGWAKPVPFTKENLKNPEKDDALISFAGPAMNLLIACAAFIAIAIILVILRIAFPGMQSLGLAEPFSETMNLSGTPFNLQILALLDVLKITMFTGSLLAVLNLLPMPPLDGSHILASALKGRAKENFEKIRPYGFFIFIAIVWTPVFDYIMMVPSLFVWGFNAVLMAALGLQ